MDKFIITIGRQLGSGGKQIAERMAKELGINYYDKNLLEQAAQASGMSERVFEHNDEQKGFIQNLLHARLGAGGMLGGNTWGNNVLSEESIFQIQSDVIRKIAQQESCIFLGRCADYILREEPRILNIFIVADEEERLKNIANRQNISPEQARLIMERADDKRSKYYNYHTGKIWGASSSYDICLNVSRLGMEASYQMLLDFVKKVFQIA